MRRQWGLVSAGTGTALVCFVIVGLIGQRISDFSEFTPATLSWWAVYSLIFAALLVSATAFARIWASVSGASVLATVTCISAWVAVSLLLVLPLFIDASFGSSFDASSEWGFFSLVCGIVIAGAAAAVSFGASCVQLLRKGTPAN
ncbi:hypothetical protein [Brevibacterium metallidurans]|uniref:hypothetical protein n=1 Tax=Brevibacterium metallidurans TaxID=1482676 RepID=UPI0030DC233A